MKKDKWGICDLKPKDEPKPSSKNHYKAVLPSLRPCTNYYATLTLYMGKNEDQKPIFLGSSEVNLEVKTMPDMSTPFALNLKAKIKKSSLTIYIPKSDLNECISYQDLKFSICQRYLERGSCFLTKRGDIQGDVDSNR